MSGVDYRAELYRTYELGNEGMDEALFQEKVDYFRHRIGPYLPGDKNAAIADLACGVGEFLWLARAQGYTNVIGIDLSEPQLAHARRMGLTNVQAESLFDHLPKHPGAYDFILLGHVVEHLTKDELMRCMHLAVDALKPGGRIALLTPNAASPFGFIYAVSDFTHELLLTATSLSQVARAVGLEVVFLGGTTPNPRAWRGKARAALWRTVRPALAAIYGIPRIPFGRVMEPELLGVFARPSRS
jgi:2-polyprenyl-3-methyl-5-hydroxy-6-metoxy-1,4-benzoquinol methylase